MFSKALFKQSMKANWIKWVSVTVSTCVMLAIVIIVLGNLAINDIRDSLKNVFVQANQESYLKENTVDSYQLYMTSLDSYNQIAGYGAYISTITSNYNNRVQAHETEYGTTPTDDEKQDYINQTSNELGDLATMIGKNPEEMKALISQLLNFYIQQNPQIEGVELLDAFFINSIYVSSYEYALTKPDATNETALNEADKAKDIATDAILVYKTDAMEADFVYNSENYILTANSYVNLMMFNEAYNNAISEGYSSDEAKQIAVSVKVIANTAISTYYLWLNEFESQNNGEPLTQQQIQDALDSIMKGRTSFVIAHRLSLLGYKEGSYDLDNVYTRFKELADLKGQVFDYDLEALLFFSQIQEEPEQFKLEYLTVLSGGKNVIPTASLKMRIGDEVVSYATTGNGPVDAVYQAIYHLTGYADDIKLEKYDIKSKGEGKDALGQVDIIVNYKGKVFHGMGLATDIIQSSAFAMIHACNSIYRSNLIALEKQKHHDIEFVNKSCELGNKP